MPYDRNTYFNPSTKYRIDWSLVPQILTLDVDNHKTRSYHSGLSSILPIYVVFTLVAIGLDFFLGFKFLANQGVSLVSIILVIFFDWFLAVLPYIIEQNFPKLNHSRCENTIFLNELQCTTKKIGETEEQYSHRKAKLEHELKDLNWSVTKIKIIKFGVYGIILVLAYWKIYSFKSVLPPSISLFSIMNGKIVIMAALLCAVLHIIASEKSLAYLKFISYKGSELANYRKTNNNTRPTPERIEIEYAGKFNNAKSGNSAIVIDNDKIYLERIHIIWDDEIVTLVNAQTDLDAKKAVAIKCKENQIL